MRGLGVFKERASTMTRQDQKGINQRVIQRLERIDETGVWRLPSYRVVVDILNREGYTTSRGNSWTCKSLFRMLQRSGYGGLHGLKQTIN